MTEQGPKSEVLMHKRTAKLVEYIPKSWWGKIIFYDMADMDKPVDDDTPIIFDDDERFPNLDEYESLGEL